MNRYPDFIRPDRSPDWERPTLRQMPDVAFGPMDRKLLPRERLWSIIETTLAIAGGVGLAALLIVGVLW